MSPPELPRLPSTSNSFEVTRQQQLPTLEHGLSDAFENIDIDDVAEESPARQEAEEESPVSRESYPIWKAMQPDDLFELTTLSDDMKEKVPTLKLGITRIEFNDGHFRTFVASRGFNTLEETKIEMIISPQTYLPSKLKRFSGFLRTRVWGLAQYRKINGVNYEVEKTHVEDQEEDDEVDEPPSSYRSIDSRNVYTVYTYETSETYSDLLRHLFHIFPNELPLFSLDLRGIRTQNFEVPAKILAAYEQCRLCPCLAIKIEKNEFVEQAHRILEKMEMLVNLRLDIVAEGTEFFSPKMISINHLYISYAKNTISEANLLTLDCETIKLWAVTIGAKSLNKFIKKWYESRNMKFQYLEMPCMHLEEDDKDLKDVLKDLDAKKFDEDKRAPIFKSYEWDYEFNCRGKQRFIKCHTGWDIEREDGLLATIIHQHNLFYFLVWHDRFPDQPVDHIRYLDAEE